MMKIKSFKLFIVNEDAGAGGVSGAGGNCTSGVSGGNTTQGIDIADPMLGGSNPKKRKKVKSFKQFNIQPKK